MVEDIYDPLEEYSNVYREKFKKVCEDTFAELAREANIDIEANRQTCQKVYDNEAFLAKIKSKITWWTVLCVLLWIGVIVGALSIYGNKTEWGIELMLAVGVGSALSLFFLISKVHPKLKSLKSERDNISNIITCLKDEAWNQMAPLNQLYDWDILTRMMTKTVPRLEFDRYFTTQRLADLRKTYGWDDSFNEERSVVYSHSGLINGNPFVICRTRKMEMGTKIYHGYKTIYWTETETDDKGNRRRVQRSETLHATVTAPYPEYFEKTRLIYGNTAAPDLKFYRKPSGLAGKESSLRYKWNRFTLRRKSRNLENGDFAMLTNEEFEVAFNTSNRNNNQQYALLFTPLAQESMMRLLQDDKDGFGDDFDFDKNKMINIIFANHIQGLNLDLNPNQYHSFDYDKAQEDFQRINSNYFRAIYFVFAPLLCVPMYQQIRPQSAIYGLDMPQKSSFWEHEALANFWGQKHFQHPQCVTNCILKTEEAPQNDGSTLLNVSAYGYRSESRITYISKFGGDGHYHNVPVEWNEYLPVTGYGSIVMREDNSQEVSEITQKQRLSHIDEVLKKSNLNIYRRHIASKV